MGDNRLAAQAIGTATVLACWANLVAADDIMLPPVYDVTSPRGKYVLTVDLESARLTMTERCRGGTVTHWVRESPLPIDSVVFEVADGGPYAALRTSFAIDPNDTYLAFLGASGEVAREYSLGDVVPEREVEAGLIGVRSLVRHRHEYVLVTPNGTLRVFEMPSGRPMAASAAVQSEICDELRAWLRESEGLGGLTEWSELLSSDTPFRVLSGPDLPLASAPMRPRVSLSGMDLVILIGGLVGLLAVAAYCATRKHWRVTPERPTRW